MPLKRDRSIFSRGGLLSGMLSAKILVSLTDKAACPAGAVPNGSVSPWVDYPVRICVVFTTFTFELPPQPPWEGLHPLVIHFPIALLFITPVFVLLAAFLGKHGRWFGLTALMLLVMGTVSGAVAVSAGKAAFDALESVEDGGWEVGEEHQQAAEEVQIMLIGLTLLYALLFAIPLVIPKWNVWKYWLLTNLVFLALLMVANLQLAHAAHLGGRLVNQYGARAILGDVAAKVGTLEPEAAEHDDNTFDDQTSQPTEEPSDSAAELNHPAG